MLRVQSEVALAISGKVELHLGEETRRHLKAAPTVSPEAHEAYLQGLHTSELRTKSGMEQAIEEFEKAVRLDPNYAAAYAALARVYSLTSVPGGRSAQESMPKAREAAMRAVSLNDSLAEGHVVLGFIKAHFEFDWPGAEREYRRGLELSPNDANAHFFYSNSYLSPLGRHEEAITEMKKAIELDPFSAVTQSFLGRTYLWARHYEDALNQFKKCADMFPGFAINQERLAHLYTYSGRFEEAIGAETKARLLSGEDPKSVLQKEDALRQALKEGGSQGYWKKVLELSQSAENPPEAYRGAYGTAILFVRLSDKQNALEVLEKAFGARELAMTEIGIEPALDPLRGETRFQNLLRRVGLAK